MVSARTPRSTVLLFFLAVYDKRRQQQHPGSSPGRTQQQVPNSAHLSSQAVPNSLPRTAAAGLHLGFQSIINICQIWPCFPRNSACSGYPVFCTLTDLAVCIAAFKRAQLCSDALQLTPDVYSLKCAIHLQVKQMLFYSPVWQTLRASLGLS